MLEKRRTKISIPADLHSAPVTKCVKLLNFVVLPDIQLKTFRGDFPQLERKFTYQPRSSL